MSDVYKTCGKFDTNSFKAEAKTFLPKRKTIGFNYVCYINISTKDYFAVLGILIDNEHNPDWRLKTEVCEKMNVTPTTIDLKGLKLFKTSTVKFDGITENDKIIFMCLHDDKFNCDNFGEYEDDCMTDLIIPRIIEIFNENSSKGKRLPKVKKPSGPPTKMPTPVKPRVVNGGILSINSSC